MIKRNLKTPILNRLFLALLYFPARVFAYCDYSFFYAWRRLVGAENLKALKVKGEGCVIHGGGRITCPDRVFLGNFVHVGEGYYFHTEGRLEIGDGTVISRNVTIYTANHRVASDCLPFGSDYATKPVTIGRGVWIGMGVSILPGVTVGDGAVIGLGTVVAEDVPPGAYYVGPKGRTPKFRAEDSWRKSISESRYFGRLNEK